MQTKESASDGSASALAAEALCLAIRHPSALGPAERERARLLLRTVPTGALLACARRHRCTAYLGRLAGDPRVNVSEETMRALRAELRIAAARGAFLAAEAVRLTRGLAECGMACMILKGPALDCLAHEDGMPRMQDDLDVLVRRADYPGARQALMSWGFVPQLRLSPCEERAQLAAGWDFHFRSADGAHSVELCTGIAPHYQFRMPEEMLWAERQTVALPSGPVQTPCTEMLLIALAVHGAKHLWSRLAWVADVDGLLRRAVVDWDRVEETARRLGAWRMVQLACLLANRVCGLELPAGPSVRADGDRTVVRLAEALLKELRAGRYGGGGHWREFVFLLASRERLRERLRYGWDLAVMPSYGDWRWVRLPPALFGLYYLLRPLRLAAKACRTVAGVKKRAK